MGSNWRLSKPTGFETTKILKIFLEVEGNAKPSKTSFSGHQKP
jgi:hypothetical protein